MQQGSDVADDRQNFELVVRADADGVVRADTVPTGELRRHWADTPRAATEHLGSLAELLRYAKHAQYNLAHYEAARAAHEVFFWMFTAPILITAWPFLWAYVIRFVRAVTFWVLTIVVAMPLNDLADWLVPDGLDVRTWSASAVQVAVGFVVVFVVATGLVVRRRRR